MCVVTLAAAAWAVTFHETAASVTGSSTSMLRVATAAGTVVVAGMLLRLATLTGTATSRLVGTSALLLAVAALAGLPAVGSENAAAVLPALRVAGMLSAASMAAATIAWPKVDTRIGTALALLAGAGLAVAVLPLAIAALTIAPTASAALSGLAVAAAAATAGCLLVIAQVRGQRVPAIAAVLLAVWAAAELPLAVPALVPATWVLETLRLVTVAVAAVAAVGCLEAAFVAQRTALLRTEQDRDRAEHELRRWREWDRERAHEATSALKSIDAASALLVRYQDTHDDEWQTLSGGIRAEVQRLQHLVDSASQPPDPGLLDLTEVAREEAALARQTGTPVDVRVSGELDVFGERPAVSSILHNLLDNAGAHAPGATVTVHADAPEPDDAEVELRVVDDGPGLPAGAVDALFTRGYQVEGHSGDGLGLYLARSLAERGGGALWAENAPGGGAAFILRLPRSSVSGRSKAGTEVG